MPIPSQLFSLNGRDIWKSAIAAVMGAILIKVGGMIQVPGFNFLTVDWASLFNLALATFIGVLSQRFTTDERGRFLGKV
jgi:hypothetical protein